MRNTCLAFFTVFLSAVFSNQSFAQLTADVKIKKNTVIIDEVPAFEIFPDADGNGFDLLTLKGDTLMKVRHRAYRNPDNYTPQNPTGQVDYYELIFPTLGNKSCELPYPMHGQAPTVVPSSPGQDAFGAVQEIVRILEADPATDWSKVNLAVLREHLIDMNEVTLRANAAERPVEGGLEIAVTGGGRMLDAIRRMIPAHARELDAMPRWDARTEPLPDGVRLTVSSAEPGDVARIRGLGFIGLLVSGSHHQPHHLMMARGQHFH